MMYLSGDHCPVSAFTSFGSGINSKWSRREQNSISKNASLIQRKRGSKIKKCKYKQQKRHKLVSKIPGYCVILHKVDDGVKVNRAHGVKKINKIK